MKVLNRRAVLCLAMWLTVTEYSLGYAPKGWRPQGQSFDPSCNHLNAYYTPSANLIYGTRGNSPTRQPALVTTTPANSTPRSREPTTASGVNDQDDVNSNSPVAIANSFAFNRPVYIFNTFPLHSVYTPGYTFFK